MALGTHACEAETLAAHFEVQAPVPAPDFSHIDIG